MMMRMKSLVGLNAEGFDRAKSRMLQHHTIGGLAILFMDIAQVSIYKCTLSTGCFSFHAINTRIGGLFQYAATQNEITELDASGHQTMQSMYQDQWIDSLRSIYELSFPSRNTEMQKSGVFEREKEATENELGVQNSSCIFIRNPSSKSFLACRSALMIVCVS
jgi:hypothetical protein